MNKTWDRNRFYSNEIRRNWRTNKRSKFHCRRTILTTETSSSFLLHISFTVFSLRFVSFFKHEKRFRAILHLTYTYRTNIYNVDILIKSVLAYILEGKRLYFKLLPFFFKSNFFALLRSLSVLINRIFEVDDRQSEIKFEFEFRVKKANFDIAMLHRM